MTSVLDIRIDRFDNLGTMGGGSDYPFFSILFYMLLTEVSMYADRNRESAKERGAKMDDVGEGETSGQFFRRHWTGKLLSFDGDTTRVWFTVAELKRILRV